MAIRFPLNKIGQLLSYELKFLRRNNVHFPIKLNNFQTRSICISNSSSAALKSTKKISEERTAHFNNKNKLLDEKSVYIAQNDPDTFGNPKTLSSLATEEDERYLEDIEDEEQQSQNLPGNWQKLRVIDYARMIKDYLNNNQIKEAVDVLEVRMLKEDHVKPTKYIYNLLISGCAKTGYSKKAFQLYNKMKQRGLPISAGTYTSLFNACANTPWPQDGLNKANRLREVMLEKGYIPNSKNYNAMIKAYGRCGDIETAFQLTDEMMEKQLPITTETFNFLLQACASEEEFGFRHALITWHKMLKQNLIPDIYSFNLMLRCVRDCSIGDVGTTQEIISQLIAESKEQLKIASEPEKSLLLEAPSTITTPEGSVTEKFEAIETTASLSLSSENDSKIIESNSPSNLNIPDTSPNLLSRTPHLGNLISIGEITKAEDRLLLLGGFSGFLNEMKAAKITPGIETFTALLEIIPSTRTVEKQLISMIRKIGLKADIDFFNILIKKRSMRYDYEGAKEVLSMIKTANLHPDIITYGVLALSCEKQEDARELIHEMHQKGIRMNIQILGAMLKSGCVHNNFPYIYEIMQIALEEQIKPNEVFLKHLDNFQKRCSKMIENRHPLTKSNNFKYNFKNFQNKLKIWYEEFDIVNLKFEDAVKKLNGHPYQQFKETQGKGYEDVKNEKFVRKQKIRKYIKKIKVNDLKDDATVTTNLSNV